MLNRTRRSDAVLYSSLIALVVIALAPYLWVFRVPFLTNLGAVAKDAPLVPLPGMEYFSVQSFTEVWNQYDFALYFKNSIVYSIGSTVLALVISIPGAYAFARLDFPGRKLLFYTAVFSITFPWIVLTIPVYEIYSNLGLLDSDLGVIIALAIFVQPLVLWLLQGFFRQGVPPNIEEAAQIDGLTEIGAFFRIVLPLSVPAIAAAAVFAFLTAWNNFLWVFLLTTDEQYRTAPVAVHYIMAADFLRVWNVLMAALLLLTLPPVIMYGFGQNYLNKGLGGY